MRKEIILRIISGFTVLISTLFIIHYCNLFKKASTADILSNRLSYYKEAEIINDYYARFDNATRVTVIRQTLMAIDRFFPKYFPHGPFDRKDLIAIAMVESNFNQYLVGKKKEFGIFQLLPESCEWGGIKKCQFDINVNTELALFVLSKKYDKYKEYKLTIISYNGVVKTSKGKISEVYWDKFIKQRKLVDDLLKESDVFKD